MSSSSQSIRSSVNFKRTATPYARLQNQDRTAPGEVLSITHFGFEFAVKNFSMSQSIDRTTYAGRGWSLTVSPDEVTLVPDWLGSKNIFYSLDSQSGGVDQGLIDFDTAVDEVGLDLYLRYGYCSLGRTPFRGLKYLQPTESLKFTAAGVKKIKSSIDPFASYCDRGESSVTEVVDLIGEWFRQRYQDCRSPIIVPLTAGYDSRFLTAIFRDVFPKKKMFSATYGVALKPEWDHEVTIAKKISKKLETTHLFVPISTSRWDQKIAEWIRWRGVASHAHGMHYMSFCEDLANRLVTENSPHPHFVSGIYGDLYAGNHHPRQKGSLENDYEGFFLTHGLRLTEQLRVDESREILQRHMESAAQDLPEDFRDLTILARNKIVLINYLVDIPQCYGFETDSPFLEPTIAAAIMALPKTEKKNRVWQQNFFQARDLNPSIPLWPLSRSNVFHIRAANALLGSKSLKQISRLGSVEEKLYAQEIRGKGVLFVHAVIELLFILTYFDKFLSRVGARKPRILRSLLARYFLLPLILAKGSPKSDSSHA